VQFKDITGQKELISRLINSAEGGRIAHAQLFFGPEGSQKLPVALAYAQFINCRTPVMQDGHPVDSCGKCSSCVKFSRLEHPDLHFFFPNNDNAVIEKSRSVDYLPLWRNVFKEYHGEFSYQTWINAMEIGANKQAIINKADCDTLLSTLNLRKFEADYRIVIIWMAEKISDTISGALLKTLEEPEEGTVFILITEDPDNIIATIRSRTQLVRFFKLSEKDIEQGLVTQFGIDANTARIAAQKSDGNILEGLRCVQNNDEDKENHDEFVLWMRYCYAANVPSILSFSEKMKAYSREKIKYFLFNSLEEFRRCLLIGYGAEKYVKTTDEEKSFSLKFAPFINKNNINKFYSIINETIYNTDRNGNIPLLLTDASLKFCKIFAAERKQQTQ
jgi:DNA polymerase-3 subunit delta'